MTTIVVENGAKDMRKEAFRICQEYLDAPWCDIDISQFNFSTVSGGLSNSIFRCALSDSAVVKNSRTPKEVLLRIYGPVQDESHVIVTEAATFMLLAERGLGPRLYGVFPKGRLEQYIPSRSLKKRDYRHLSSAIARELAKIHALDVPVRKIPDFWKENMLKFLNDTESKANGTFELGDMYRREMEWLGKEIEKSKSPVVYCHNDLQGGNILLREDSPSDEDPKLLLIDFEFGSYNYRGFDIANQFCEWCFDYSTGEYPYFTVDFDKFPSEEEQTSYIRAYLDQLVLEGSISPSEVEEQVVAILNEITLFAMAAHLLWSLWSAKMSYHSIMDFAHKEHFKTRKQAYELFKQKYMRLHLCNGDSS